MTAFVEVNNFQREVIEKSHQVPVLVDFWAEWCGPCKILGPVLERLAQQSNGRWALAKVDTERHTDLAVKYGIRSIPAVKLFIDGRVADEFVGALPEPVVRQWLEKALPGKFDKEIEQAEVLLAGEKTDEARAILEGILSRDGNSHRARVLLAKSLIGIDLPRARELVKPIEEDSEHYELAEAIRTFADLSAKLQNPASLPEGSASEPYLSGIRALVEKDYSAALERFIEVIREDRHYDGDGARKACIAIFKLLGEEHEITQKHRRDFSSALY